MTLDEAIEIAKCDKEQQILTKHAQACVILAAEIDRRTLGKDARRDLAKVRAFLTENVAPLGLIERFEAIRKRFLSQ